MQFTLLHFIGLNDSARLALFSIWDTVVYSMHVQKNHVYTFMKKMMNMERREMAIVRTNEFVIALQSCYFIIFPLKDWV